MKKLLLLICILSVSTILSAKTKQSDRALEKSLKEQAKIAQMEQANVRINNETLPLYEVKSGLKEKLQSFLVKSAVNTYSTDVKSPRKFIVTEYSPYTGRNFKHLVYYYRSEILAPYAKIKDPYRLNTPYRNKFSAGSNMDLDKENWEVYLPQKIGVKPIYNRLIPEQDSAVFAFYYPEDGRFAVIRMVYKYNPAKSYLTSYVYEDQFTKEQQNKEVLPALQQQLIKEIEQISLPDTFHKKS